MPALAVCSADAIGQQSTCLKCAVNTARIRPLRTVSPSFLLRGYAMTCRYAAIGVAVASLLASSAFAGGPYGSISAGNWKGGAYTNDKTGAFSHCGASSGYANGVIFSSHTERRRLLVAGVWKFKHFSCHLGKPSQSTLPLTVRGSSGFSELLSRLNWYFPCCRAVPL